MLDPASFEQKHGEQMQWRCPNEIEIDFSDAVIGGKPKQEYGPSQCSKKK